MVLISKSVQKLGIFEINWLSTFHFTLAHSIALITHKLLGTNSINFTYFKYYQNHCKIYRINMMVFSMWRSEQWEILANVWIYFFFFLVSISLVLHNYLTILPFFFWDWVVLCSSDWNLTCNPPAPECCSDFCATCIHGCYIILLIFDFVRVIDSIPLKILNS